MNRSRTDPEQYLEQYLEFEKPHSSTREFLSIKNLDTYFMDIYDYHRYGGYCAIIYSKISYLITIAFTILFSLFLVGFVDWFAVLHCGHSDNECEDVHLIKNNINSHKTFGAIVIIYIIVFVMYFIWQALHFVFYINSLTVTRKFYHEKLKINEEKLRRIQWPIVMHSIVSLQKKSVLLYHNKFLDTLDITNRIMRKENYMIAFIHKHVLRFNLPKISIPKIRKTLIKYQYVDEAQNDNYDDEDDDDDEEEADDDDDDDDEEGFLSTVLLWNIKYIIFQSMFDDEMRIKDSFKNGSQHLKWKFFCFGVLNLIFCPFILSFRILFFFLQNAEEIQTSKNSDVLSFRQWTFLAKLKFREFNELPHDFEKRMSLSIKPATEFVESLCKPPHILIISELISYISGSIVAVLLLLTAIDSSILLNIQLFGRSLVWFLAIFSALLAVARAHVVYNDPSQNYQEKMNEIARYTHYFPKKWQTECHKAFVWKQFTSLFQPKLNLFFNELLNVFATPFILMFTLPNCVDDLLEFVTNHSDSIDGVGDICSFGNFKINANLKEESQNINLLAKMEDNIIRQISNVSNVSSNSSASISSTNVLLTNNSKKLESSFLTFAVNNPNWRAIKQTNQKQNTSTAQLGLTFSELLHSCAENKNDNDNQQQVMLSEINESETFAVAPYKTLAMELDK